MVSEFFEMKLSFSLFSDIINTLLSLSLLLSSLLFLLLLLLLLISFSSFLFSSILILLILFISLSSFLFSLDLNEQSKSSVLGILSEFILFRTIFSFILRLLFNLRILREVAFSIVL